MIFTDKKHELREHLAVISTAAYLLLRSNEEDERIKRYNMLQEQIDAILKVIEDHKSSQPSCPDVMFQ